MKSHGLARRLIASFVQSDGRWEIDRKGKGRLILRRDEIVSPLFSPLWLLGGIFLFYISWVITLGLERGWRGIAALVVPAIALMWVTRNRAESDFRLEHLEFNKSDRILKSVESNGKTKISRNWAYAEIASFLISEPLFTSQIRVSTIIFIKHRDPSVSDLCIVGLGEMAEIYRAIDEILPLTIERHERVG